MAPLLTRLSQSFGFGASTGGETNTGLTASGGTTSTYTDSGKTYKVHVFTSSGAFTVSAAAVGGVTATAPSGSGDTVQKVGVALHADMVYFNFNTTEVLLA